MFANATPRGARGLACLTLLKSRGVRHTVSQLCGRSNQGFCGAADNGDRPHVVLTLSLSSKQGDGRKSPLRSQALHAKASHRHLPFGFLLTKNLLSKIKSVKLLPHGAGGRHHSLTLTNSNNQKVIEIRGRKANKFLWLSLVPSTKRLSEELHPAQLQAIGYEEKKKEKSILTGGHSAVSRLVNMVNT